MANQSLKNKKMLSKNLENYVFKENFKAIFDVLKDSMNFNVDENLIVGLITPDREIVENSKLLDPAYITFSNYELILKWNRSLRFALAVC